MQHRLDFELELAHTPKYELPYSPRLPLPPGKTDKSSMVGSDWSAGSVGARHTRLRIELYAKNLLSGLKVASVIVHWPNG